MLHEAAYEMEMVHGLDMMIASQAPPAPKGPKDPDGLKKQAQLSADRTGIEWGCKEENLEAASPLDEKHAEAQAARLGVSVKDAISITSFCNLALPLSYFSVGFAIAFVDTPLKIYLVKTLNVGAAHLQILKTLKTLPWSSKVLAGLLSDCIPMMGMRRKPYFVLGWSVFFIACASMASVAELTVRHIYVCYFLSILGFVMADVSADSLVVERSRLEPKDRAGHFQTAMVISRFLGSFVGHVLGAILYNKEKWGWGLSIGNIFWLQAALPAILFCLVTFYLRDTKGHVGCRSLVVQCQSLWTLMRRRTVWKPMFFIAWYYLCHVPCAAWEPFLIKGLGFPAFKLGLLATAGAAFSFAGCAFYKGFMMDYSWRNVYVATTVIATGFAALQILLVFRINKAWHIPDLWFAMGDEAVSDFIAALHFMPMVNFMIALCPEGAEGTSFSMITTLANVTRSAASNIGVMLVPVWDVSNRTLKHQHFDGVWKLIALTSGIQLIGLLPVRLLPHGRFDMLGKKEHLDFYGGVGFLAFLLGAWTWTIAVSILEAMNA